MWGFLCCMTTRNGAGAGRKVLSCFENSRSVPTGAAKTMDEAKEKVKNFFRKKKFKGPAHVLGTTDSQPEASQPVNSYQPQPQPAPQPRPQSANPSRLLQADEDRQKKDKTKKTALQKLAASEPRRPQVDEPTPSPSGSAVTPVPESAVEEIHLNVGLLISDEKGKETSSTIKKVLRNIFLNPSEEKYRRLRLDNPKIAQLICGVEGAVGLLLACGFTEQVEEATKFLVFPKSGNIGAIQEALRRLEVHFPSEPTVSKPATTGREAGDKVEGRVNNDSAVLPERDTQLLLMRPTEVELPEWFFARTGAEIRADYLAAKKRQEDSKVLMTRAQRERLAQKDKKMYTMAQIRVRMPEGVLLQGNFSGKESVVGVHEWVAEQLRDPSRPFELYLPSREKLPLAGSVSGADLLPATLLSFRWTDGLGMIRNEPTVIDKLLAGARLDWV